MPYDHVTSNVFVDNYILDHSLYLAAVKVTLSRMAERRPPVTAPELLLKIVLTGTQSHYESRGLIDEKRLDHLLHAGKQILYKSHQESDVRQNLGFSPAVWQGLTTVLNRAIPVLEDQSFAWKTNTDNEYRRILKMRVPKNRYLRIFTKITLM